MVDIIATLLYKRGWEGKGGKALVYIVDPYYCEGFWLLLVSTAGNGLEKDEKLDGVTPLLTDITHACHSPPPQ